MARHWGAAAVTGPPSLVIGRHCRRPSRCRARATKHPSNSDAGSASRPAGLSNAPRARPASTEERQRCAEIVRCAANAAKAAPWRNRGSLCRCSNSVRRPTQLAVWPPRGPGGQRHSAANGNFSRSASGAQARACTWSGQRALAALDRKSTPEDRPPRAVGCARPSLAGSLGRGKPPRQLTALGGLPGRLTRRLFTSFHSATLRSAPRPRAPPTAPPKRTQIGGTTPKRGARCLPPTPLPYTS